VEVIHTYVAMVDGELGASAGEFLTVIGNSGASWLQVANEAGQEGQIPKSNTQHVAEADVPVPHSLLKIHKRLSLLDHTALPEVAASLRKCQPALLAAAEATCKHNRGVITTNDRLAVLMGVSSGKFTQDEARQLIAMLEGKGGANFGGENHGGAMLAEESRKNQKHFLSAINVVSYGVLGMNNQNRQVAPEPDANTIFVDPANLAMIQNPKLGPSCAGGAAGAIYRYLGISRAKTFAYEVRAAVQHESDAGYKQYNRGAASKHVIHTVGPDFKRVPQMTKQEAVAKLAETYRNVFTIAAQVGRPALRLLPVSSGIFSGKFSADMPSLTAMAIIRGYKMLSEWLRACIRLDMQVELCVFGGGREAAAYATAVKAAVAKYG
jgi:hypothetical protein